MLYKLEFYQGKTDAGDYGQVVHTLADTASTRAVISLTLSADKLQSISNYTREPKRLVFEAFSDDWLQDYLLSGLYEHERYISHYELRVYRDSVLLFTGIIETSNCAYDYATGIVRITAYDRLKLFSIYSDIEHTFSILAGYYPRWLINYFAQDIQARIPVDIPRAFYNLDPTITLPSADMRQLAYLDYTDLLTLPSISGWTFSLLSPQTWQIVHGFTWLPFSQIVVYVALIPIITRADRVDPATTVYQGRFRARVYTFFNRTAPVVAEFDNITDWRETNDFTADYGEMVAWVAEQGVNSTQLASLTSTYTVDGSSYASGQALGLAVWANFYGNALPTRLHVGKYYETVPSTPSPTQALKAVQAMLMVWNATLVCSPNGVIKLIAKDGWIGTAIEIDDDDVIAYSVSRSDLEKPDVGILDVFSGDTTILQSLVKDYLVDFHASQFTAQVTIDQLAKYPLTLQSIIDIRGVTYGISEIEADPIKDEYKVKAWQL